MTQLVTLTTPLMRRTVGFDRFNDLFESILNEGGDKSDNYPPYNIEKLGDDDYRITMAVSGFSLDDLEVILHDGELRVSGQIKSNQESEHAVYLHRGIANRSFVKTFRLADYIQVVDAKMDNGLLVINLRREVPEEKKPRMIAINSADATVDKNKKAIENRQSKKKN